jgi:hypothetical protein
MPRADWKGAFWDPARSPRASRAPRLARALELEAVETPRQGGGMARYVRRTGLRWAVDKPAKAGL